MCDSVCWRLWRAGSVCVGIGGVGGIGGIGGIGGVGGVGGDALYATLYARGCGGWALFARGCGG